MSLEPKSTISNDMKTGVRQNQSPKLIRMRELRGDQSGAKTRLHIVPVLSWWSAEARAVFGAYS